MRIFYSELAENPAYYSFGYSVYGVLEEGDTTADAFESGFLPCVIAADQPKGLMYQTRGVRVLASEFTRRHYHHRVVRKAESLGELETVVHPLKEFAFDTSVQDFFLRYFTFRFGKESMSRERLLAIVASGWITHVSEFRIAGKPVAYMLEHHSEGLIHVWYQAYEKKYEHAHLGSYLYILLIERAKEAGKQHVYFGVSYGSWMKYKANFAPLEYWNGSEWVRDANGKKVKDILSEGITLIPYTDRWRSVHAPFYAAPTSGVFARERRIFHMLFDGAPVSALLVFGIPALLLAVVVLFASVI